MCCADLHKPPLDFEFIAVSPAALRNVIKEKKKWITLS